MWIWPFLWADSVVFVFCTKFGSNICYSHWDRRTYASDLRLMTSRRLTSGFDFWLCGHLGMHLPMKCGANIFIQSGVINIFFPKLKMVAAAILDLFGWAMVPPTKPHSWCVPPVKFCYNRLGSFRVISIWFFSRSGLKVLFTFPKFQCFGGLYPQNLVAHCSDPQKTLLFAERRIAFSLVQIWRTLQPVALAKKPKKERKKDNGKLAIRPDHPRCRIKVKVCMPGGLRCVVLYIKFH